jgi:hypothetical protein
MWIADGPCEESDGVCHEGMVKADRIGCSDPGTINASVCDDTCHWQLAQTCGTDCVGPYRTEGRGEEICIPGGGFLFGTSDADGYYPEEQPLTAYVVSPYFIDKYPVTNARYLECVLAGVCTVPLTTHALGTFGQEGYEDYPVYGVSGQQAIDFCDWDGGREVAVSHFWEKAARGAYPEYGLYPWGDEVPSCDNDLQCLFACGDLNGCPIGAHPGGASPYGVEDMLTPGVELVAQGPGYYGDCYVDPPHGVVSPLICEIRSLRTSFNDHSTCTGAPIEDTTFRCMRKFVNPLPLLGLRCDLTVP